MKKIFNILLVTICCFGFISVVNAEESWGSITDDTAFVKSLIEGADLKNNSSATAFFTKYDVYYKYQKIDDTLYSNWISDMTEGTSNGAVDTVNALVPAVNTTDDLGTWIKATEPVLSFSDIGYDSSKKTGYILALAAVDKTDNTKIYVTRAVQEVTGTGSLGSSYDINCNDDATTGTDTNDSSNSNGGNTSNTNTDTSTKENPNTGISDYAIYLVPIALIGGTVLMMRKNYA